jgi:hypothetical protein
MTREQQEEKEDILNEWLSDKLARELAYKLSAAQVKQLIRECKEISYRSVAATMRRILGKGLKTKKEIVDELKVYAQADE